MKIESIKIKHIVEEQPDLSWLGTYSNTPTEHYIDRQERGDMGRNEFRYFNLGCGELEYLEKDYERAESYNNQQWCCIGIVAEATVSYHKGAGCSRLETLSSGGLWGVESDSGDYLDTIADDELEDLRDHLKEFGISCADEDWIELCEQAKAKV